MRGSGLQMQGSALQMRGSGLQMQGSGLRMRGAVGWVQDVGIAAFEVRMRGSGAPNAGIGLGSTSAPLRKTSATHRNLAPVYV